MNGAKVWTRPRLLMRSAFANARTVSDSMGSEKIIKGGASGRRRTARDDVAVAAFAGRIGGRAHAVGSAAEAPVRGGVNRSTWKPRMAARPWAALRRFVLDRDGWQCQRCGRYGRLEVHHVNGDPADNRPAALTTLCRGCHIAAHAPVVTPSAAAWRELVRSAERGSRDPLS